MVTLSLQYGFMSIQWLAFNHEYNVSIDVLIDDLSLIFDECVGRLIRYFIDLHLTDVKDTYVVQPFTAVESSKDEELLGADDTCCVPLTTYRCLVDFDGMAPPHGLGVQNVEIVRWNDLLQASATAIVAAK